MANPAVHCLALSQGVAEQDSFEVPGDDPSSSLGGEPALEQSLVRPPQSASGAAAVAALGAAGAPPGSVDPFSPRFQESMLASLEPPVLEVGAGWVGRGGWCFVIYLLSIFQA